MDFIPFASLDRLGAVAVLALVALSIITDKLVWHTRLKQAEARADKWERLAWEALTASAQVGVKTAEVAVGVVAALPDPELRRQQRGTDT